MCLICRQAEIVEGLTSIKFERGEFRLVVNGVPARVCPRCAEAYVEQEVTRQVLRIVKDLSEVGLLDGHCQYHPA